MEDERRLPWPGMALLALAMIALALAGIGPLALFFVAAVWLLSLWFDWLRPKPPQADIVIAEKPDLDALLLGAMRDAIGGASVPLVIAGPQRIVAANGAARALLGAHIVGQDPRVALRYPDAVALIEGGIDGSATITGVTGAQSRFQVSRRQIDPRHFLIEMRDRSAESDISRAHTDFVANASHELRTPLASIIGYAETLVDKPEAFDPPTLARFLGTILREAKRMQSLVADLMSLSQLEAEKHDVPTERFELATLAARVVGEFVPMEGGEVRLELTQHDAPLTVTGDASQLAQLLRNLIDNARKYGEAGQPVIVRVGPGPVRSGGGAMAELTVIDRGPGIAPDHLPHLTRRFYRTDPGRSRAAGGTGLGLAIVKHVVERHRGKLDISSRLGVGTTVSVLLPIAPAIARSLGTDMAA